MNLLFNLNVRNAAAWACLAFVLGCSRTPEEAKQKLAELNVPVTSEALLASTKKAKTEDVAVMLVQSGVDPNARQGSGMTALMSAVFNGQKDVAQALLDKGADVAQSAKGQSALTLAVERDDRSMVKLLLAHGADPSARPGPGLSALERAEQRANTDMLELLRSHAK